ncbi:MAG TPA: hypothetical protein VF407_12705 [Polyangiaceae bacterium]
MVRSIASSLLSWSLVLALGAGCAKASGDVTGGDALFDAAAPPGATVDPGPLGTGHTFDELYADYFGNPARASCAGNGACHGNASQRGAQISSFVCPADNKDDCYTSLVSAAADLVKPGSSGKSALITQVLRRADGSKGDMPQAPPYGFTDTDLQRISDWIDDGAKNDVAVDDAGADGGLDAATDDSGITDSGSD